MPFRARMLMAFALAAALNAPAQAQAPRRWMWIIIQPRSAGTGWDVRQGEAVVRLDPHGGFHTELDVDEGDLGQHYRLDGVVQHGRVDATETLLNSDASPRRYIGSDDDPVISTEPPAHGACLHLHSGQNAIHLCQEFRP